MPLSDLLSQFPGAQVQVRWRQAPSLRAEPEALAARLAVLADLGECDDPDRLDV